jgi:hypothetical protein
MLLGPPLPRVAEDARARVLQQAGCAEPDGSPERACEGTEGEPARDQTQMGGQQQEGAERDDPDEDRGAERAEPLHPHAHGLERLHGEVELELLAQIATRDEEPRGDPQDEQGQAL